MASPHPLHGTAPPPSPANDRAPAAPALRAWLEGAPAESRLAGLLGYALASERGLAPNPAVVAETREEAERLLAEHAIRHVHNRVAEIRAQAVAEALGALPRPPGIRKIVMGNLLALALVALAAAALYAHPETLAALVGLISG